MLRRHRRRFGLKGALYGTTSLLAASRCGPRFTNRLFVRRTESRRLQSYTILFISKLQGQRGAWHGARLGGAENTCAGRNAFPSCGPVLVQMGCAGPDLNRGSFAPVPISTLSRSLPCAVLDLGVAVWRPRIARPVPCAPLAQGPGTLRETLKSCGSAFDYPFTEVLSLADETPYPALARSLSSTPTIFPRASGSREAQQHSSLPVRVQASATKAANMSASRSKAEERYAEIQKRERGLRQELDTATRLRLEKTAKLRQLRLAKEAEDAAQKQAAKDIKTAGKAPLRRRAPSKLRNRARLLRWRHNSARADVQPAGARPWRHMSGHLALNAMGCGNTGNWTRRLPAVMF